METLLAQKDRFVITIEVVPPGGPDPTPLLEYRMSPITSQTGK